MVTDPSAWMAIKLSTSGSIERFGSIAGLPEGEAHNQRTSGHFRFRGGKGKSLFHDLTS
jgi:hypothetical protein